MHFAPEYLNPLNIYVRVLCIGATNVLLLSTGVCKVTGMQ
jgi:hypothetical protein